MMPVDRIDNGQRVANLEFGCSGPNSNSSVLPYNVLYIYGIPSFATNIINFLINIEQQLVKLIENLGGRLYGLKSQLSKNMSMEQYFEVKRFVGNNTESTEYRLTNARNF